MPKSLNKLQIIGNLGHGPEVRVTQGGTKVATLSIATTETWNDRDGNRQEHTEWHKVIFWGNLADVCEKYLDKGSRVYVEGSMRTRKWEDRDGNTRYSTEVNGRDLIMLDARRESEDNRPFGDSGGNPPELSDDDIPF